jgi:hypothetical protein
VYGTAVQTNGNVSGGSNTIYGGSGTNTIYGDCYSNSGRFMGGYNTIYAGSGTNTIYGDCYSNSYDRAAYGGHNTIYAGSGTNTIYGDCYMGWFGGGYNTIYAGSGTDLIWGGQGSHNTFVFQPGAGQVTIEDFDQHWGSLFDHEQGDMIDVSAYHLGGMPVIGADANGNALIYLPALGVDPSHLGQITLVGVHPFDLTASDFKV